jgi:hypothetical protein
MHPIALGLMAVGGYLLYKHEKTNSAAVSQAAINKAVSDPTAQGMMANALAPSNNDIGNLESIAQWFDGKALPRYASVVRLKKANVTAGKSVDASYYLNLITNPTLPIQ